MLSFYRKLFDLLAPHERKQFIGLLALIFVMSLIEVLGVASVLPFIYILSNPDLVEANPYFAWANVKLGFDSPDLFVLFAGVAVFVLVVLGLLIKALTQYAILKFAMMRNYSISTRMLEGYLRQPYTWFLHRNSSDISAVVLTQVNEVVHRAVLPAVRLIASSIVVVLLVALLVAVQPLVALSAALVLGAAYGGVYLFARRILERAGEERRVANQTRFHAAAEAVGGIRDVKLRGLEAAFVARYQQAARIVAERDAFGGVMGDVPRYLLEALAFGGLMAVVLFLLLRGEGTLLDIIPILALYAFAGVRLFPALQQVYWSLSTMRFGRPVLDQLHGDHEENIAATCARPSLSSPLLLRLNERLELVNIHYTYPKAEQAALVGLDLSIEARSTVGIIGGTGAGKTTLVDLMLGLLVPDSGEIMVDSVLLDAGMVPSWQRSIGYVPQQIFLTDSNIAANIAYGLEQEAIDLAAVERAARIAELHDFVIRELPRGYATVVGERGIRLSGGQRQRIGIARALYHDPDMLVLDEATSALDNLTERAVMNAVRNFSRQKTIVMIAHRLSTVRRCDRIFMIENGRLSGSGTYEELLQTSGKFRAMAGSLG